MTIPFKEPSKDFHRESAELKFIFDYLPEDHPVFVYADILGNLDTSKIEAQYSPKGQHAYHPKMLMGLLVFSYCHGVFSSREIASRCRTDIGFMYMSWMLFPDHRTISDFRKENIEEFKAFFKESVLLAKGLGMVSLGHVSLDGSKFKADTSKHKAMSYARMQHKEKELMKEIENLLEKANRVDQEEDSFLGEQSGEEVAEELKFKEQRLEKIQKAKEALEKREEAENPGKEIEGKKQISFADKEARIMGKKTFQYAYNAQISVESSHRIIVGEHLSQFANDKKEVGRAVKEIEDTLGEKPDKMSLDNGYFSADNVESLEDAGIDGYIAPGKENSSKITKENFVYNDDVDIYTCPAGKALSLKSSGAGGTKIYQAETNDCQECSLRKSCTKSKQGRSLSIDEGEPARQRMKKKMQSSKSKEVYSKRKSIVEPVFGVLKYVMGFVSFNLRGLKKVSGEFSLVCGAYNIKKIVKAILGGKVSPVTVKREVIKPNLEVKLENMVAFLLLLLFESLQGGTKAVLSQFRRRCYHTTYGCSRTVS